MKNTLIKTATIAIMGTLLCSCKPNIPKEVIEKYRADNNSYESDLSNRYISKEEIIKESDFNYNQFIQTIDPKKKTAFEKDNVLQSELGNHKACLMELADKSHTNNMLSKAMVAANNSFIESLEKGEISEEEASQKWLEYQNKFSKLQLEADSLNNEITTNKDKEYELYKAALKKYGVPTNQSKKKK